MVYILLLCMILLVVGLGLLRIAYWHQKEADFWLRTSLLVVMHPDLDPHYRGVLKWTSENKPSLLRRLRPWVSPAERQKAADA